MFCTICAVANPRAAHTCRGCGGRLDRPVTPLRGGLMGSGVVRWRYQTMMLVVAPIVALLAIGMGYQRAEQTGRARSYARALGADASGDYALAIAAYAGAAGYRDADDRGAALTTALGPARDAERRAGIALRAGRYDDAIVILSPVLAQLPDDAAAAALLADARRLRGMDLQRRADEASARRDWLAAERALAALAGQEPGDVAIAERLASLRRDHAPLAFVRDGALYLVGPDGADERLVTGAGPVARPVWSPDRSQLAFISTSTDERGPAALFVVNTDGSSVRQLSETAHPNAVPAWSPDGARIAYTSVAAFDLLTERGLLAVHVVDVATGRDRDVTSGTGRQAMTPTWSPSGDRLAFVSRTPPETADRSATDGPGGVDVLTLASGAIVDLTGDEVPDVVRVIWSPVDERLLVYVRNHAVSGGSTLPGAQLLVLDARTGTLTPSAATIEATTAGWRPAWAPDGTRYAYVDGPTTVVVHERDGQETRIKAGAYLSGAVSWAPGGEALLAVSVDPRQPSSIVTFGTDGPIVTDFPIGYDADGPGGSPEWSPPNPAR